MENRRIIFQNENGGVSILTPASNCGLTIEEIAGKDVPSGRPYKIIDESDLPSDRLQRMGWTVDEGDLNDGVGE